MIHWDKELLKESLDLFWDFRIHKKDFDLNAKNISDSVYNELRNKLADNLKTNLTTENMFNYILSKL